MISIICEGFHCLPSEAVQEPIALALRILELRGYASTYQDAQKYAMAGEDEDVELEITDTLRLLWEVEATLAARRRAQRERERNGT